MIEIVRTFVIYASDLIVGAAAVIVSIAIVYSLATAALNIRRPSGPLAIRLNLGRWLALALEFLVAADILRTAVAPTWDEIGQLAAIIVLRTALNFFLEREIREGPPHDFGSELASRSGDHVSHSPT